MATFIDLNRLQSPVQATSWDWTSADVRHDVCAKRASLIAYGYGNLGVATVEMYIIIIIIVCIVSFSRSQLDT